MMEFFLRKGLMAKAVFLDRDGTINEIVYYPDLGIIDSPFTVEQFKLLPGAGEAIKMLNQSEFKVVLVSNQPGIAKGHFSIDTFEKIGEEMKTELAAYDAFLDAEYYCLHHPEAKNAEYKENCECRKPKSGLLLKAAKVGKLNGYLFIIHMSYKRHTYIHLETFIYYVCT